MWASQGKSLILGCTSKLVVSPLDNKLRPGKIIMAARMIGVKMGADQEMNIARGESQSRELPNDGRNVHAAATIGNEGAISGNPRVDEDIFPIAGLDQVAGHRGAIVAGVNPFYRFCPNNVDPLSNAQPARGTDCQKDS